MTAMKAASPMALPILRAVSTRIVLCGAVLCCFALQSLLVFTQPINWDEFRFLADVHQLARGELTAPVQTFHSHFFRWLLWLPGTEVDQVIAGRLVMLVLEAGTTALIYRCARRLAGAEASLIAVLCYLTFAYVIRHGASFRFDPPSAFLLMAAVTLLVTTRLRLLTTMATGALVALAALITIKAVFYVPTIAGLAWWRAQEAAGRRGGRLQLVSGVICGALVLTILYLYHQSLMAPAATSASDIISASSDKTIGQSRFLPQRNLFLYSVLFSPLNWAMIIAGLAIVTGRAIHGRGLVRTEAMALAGLMLPLVTLLFYRNAFPYYYAFILAPAAVLVAPTAEWIARRLRLDLLGLAMLCTGLIHGVSAISPVLAAQRATLDAVHAIFPHPVSYIDRCSMVASSRKQGFFMSSWGTEVYRDARKPVMRNILLAQRPAYVLANSPMLEWALTGTGDDRRLLAEDVDVLRANFIPHWGAIWVAGKRIVPEAGETSFDMLIAGDYTVEALGPVQIDGTEAVAGSWVQLSAGSHTLAGKPGQAVVLRWGRNLLRPAASPPPEPLFTGL